MKKRVFMLIVVAIMVATLAGIFAACGEEPLVKLSSPQNVKYDDSTITWDAVENASKYLVKINDGQEYPITVPSYPYDGAGKQFNVTIKATADSFEDSEAFTKSFVPLGSVSELRVDENGVVTWDDVENATGYLLKVDGKEIPSSGENLFEGLTAGNHTVSVRPVVTDNDSYYSKWSSQKQITILSAVSSDSIVYEDGKISWGYVSGARCYEVAVNGTIIADNCTTTNVEYESENKNFEVTVRALGNGNTTFNSKVSEIKKFIYLATVTGVTVEDGVVVWEPVAGADGYKIKIDGIEQSSVLTSASYANLSANRSTSIQIKPISNDTTYFSNWSIEQSVLILPTPIPQWNPSLQLDGQENNNLFWDGIDNAEGYAVKVTDPSGRVNVTALGRTDRAYANAYLEVGVYTVAIKAVAATGNSNTYDSKYSEPISIKRLPTPKAVTENFVTSDPRRIKEGFTVTFLSVSGATSYELLKDRTSVMTSTTPQFNYKNVVADNVMEQQHFNFAIRAIGRGSLVSREVVLSSLTSEALPLEITVLAVPQNTTIEGFTYSYSSVSQNNGYAVDVQGAIYDSGATTYDLSVLEAGNYSVSVCTKGNGATILPSNYTAPISVQRLEAPTNIHIETADASEGVLGYTLVNNANSYEVVFDNNGQAIPVTEMMNVNEKINEKGTTIHMIAVANYFNSLRTVYYMTSRTSQTITVTKLAAPTFGDVKFTNDELIWQASNNINTNIYTPTYQVSAENGVLFTSEKNGTSMSLSNLEGGQQYTFQVKAIGDGTHFINSAKSAPVSIWKLATPEVSREDGKYVWDSVQRATNYAVYVDGELMDGEVHEYGKKYEFTPHFTQIKDDYMVKVLAVGDGGYETVDSKPYEITQKTTQLKTPSFSFKYSAEHYEAGGQITVTITESSPYARGYSYTIGGSTYTSEEETYSCMPNSVGEYAIRVYALGGNFDEAGIYYTDSQSKGGGSENTLVLLATPNQSSITILDGVISWTPINKAVHYNITIKIDGEQILSQQVTQSSYNFADYSKYKGSGSKLEITICAAGNGSNIISSTEVTQVWEHI